MRPFSFSIPASVPFLAALALCLASAALAASSVDPTSPTDLRDGVEPTYRSPFGDPVPSPGTVGTSEGRSPMRNFDDFNRRPPGFSSAVPLSSIAFFPPLTPASGVALSTPLFQFSFNGRVQAAPARLADFVNDYFYPVLGTRILTDNLSKKLDARLEAYLAKRTSLVNELLAQIELTQAADPAAREHSLQAFALTQTPALVALEDEAEELRLDLVDSGFFSRSDWNESRPWRLGVTTFPAESIAAAAEYQVMRAAAFYQAGFSIEQRGLLREIAMEILQKARPTPRLSPEASTALFFSPELAQVRPASNLAPALAEKLATYNREKTALKAELRATVLDQEKTKAAAKRVPAFEALAARQRPQLAVLDALAEEIRQGHGVLPNPPVAGPLPPIPADLGHRIDAYNREKRALNTELNVRINLAQKMNTRRPIVATHPGGLTEEELAWAQKTQGPDIVAAAIANYKRENAARYEALQHNLEALRRDLRLLAQGQPNSADGQSLDPEALMRAFDAASERFGKWGRDEVTYNRYKLATLQPGLSPPQRRLLFGAALVGLAQPLPAGERMPDSTRFYPRF